MPTSTETIIRVIRVIRGKKNKTPKVCYRGFILKGAVRLTNVRSLELFPSSWPSGHGKD